MAFIEPMNAHIDRMKTVLATRRTKGKNSPNPSPKRKGRKDKQYAEELARLKTMIAEYERSSHFTPGIVAFTGLVAGKDTTRAYQVYLSDQPGDLFWLTVKDGKLKETEFKIQPGQQGGLEVERIE